jgi:branched-chain amino acid transport system permease protein
MEIFGVSLPGLMSQLLLGLVNGSFYAILSLGLAVIFGLLNVINFAHGALFMLGAMCTWMAMSYFGINYWVMLILSPVLVGILGVLIERFLAALDLQARSSLRPAADAGVVAADRGVFRSVYGVSGLGYDTPELLGARPIWAS